LWVDDGKLIYYLSSLSSINIPINKYIEMPLAYQVKDFLEQNGLSFVVDFIFYCYYNIDKVQHIVLYFGFGILLYLTFFNSEKQSFKKYEGCKYSRYICKWDRVDHCPDRNSGADVQEIN
jgi:hypothetical protein